MVVRSERCGLYSATSASDQNAGWCRFSIILQLASGSAAIKLSCVHCISEFSTLRRYDKPDQVQAGS
jgi:hypothetical protein